MKLLKYNSTKVAVLVTIAYSISQVATSFVLSYLVVDTVDELVRNAILVLCVFAISAFLLYLSQYCRFVGDYYLTMDLNQKIDKAISYKSFSDFMSKESGEHATVYINDVPKVSELVYSKYLALVASAARSAFVLIALMQVHYSMVIIAIVSTFFLIFTTNLFQKRLSKYIVAVQQEREQYLNKIRELMQGFSAFIENSAFHVFFRKSTEASHKFSGYCVEVQKYAALISGVTTFVSGTSTVIALTVLSFFVIQGKVGAGSLLVVVGLLPTFGDSITSFTTDKAFYISGKELYNNKLALIKDFENDDSVYYKPFFMSRTAYKNAVKRQERAKSISAPNEISAENISFDFGERSIKLEQPVHFKKGGKYALIGESGCGKSSLLKAIVGEIEQYGGEIALDKQTKDRNQPLFDDIAYVNQSPYLFSDTIANNIKMDLDLSDDEVRKWMDAVHLEEFELDYFITENGKNLSGGQKQRVALARALARGKSVIFMDEATANLDRETACSIESSILDTDATVVMISHTLTDGIKQKLDAVIKISSHKCLEECKELI